MPEIIGTVDGKIDSTECAWQCGCRIAFRTTTNKLIIELCDWHKRLQAYAEGRAGRKLDAPIYMNRGMRGCTARTECFYSAQSLVLGKITINYKALPCYWLACKGCTQYQGGESIPINIEEMLKL